MVMPRYQRRGIGISAMPSVTTVGMQEAARTSQTLASSLDRISNFVFQQAEVEAKIKGAEFGALNTPTVDDIKAGAEIPGDQSTVFGRAARKASLDALLTEFEMEANSAITELRIKYSKEQISSDELRAGIANINTGLTDALKSVDPSAASALQKAIQTTGNSVYLNALSKEQDLRRKQKEVIAEIRMRELIDGIEGEVTGIVEEIVRAGDNIGPDGQKVSIDDKIENVILPELKRMSLELSDPEFYSKYADEVRQKISETKVNVVVETITEDTLNLFQANELNQSKAFEDKPKVKALYDSLTVDERKAVREQVDAFVDEMQAEADQAESRAARRLDKRILDTSVALQAAISKADGSEESEQAIKEQFSLLEAISPSTANSFREVAQSGGAQVDDRDTKRGLLIDKTNGRLTIQKLNQAFSDRLITKSTYESMFEQFIQQQDSRYQEGLRVLKNAIGYPEYDSIANGPVQRDAVREVARIENEYIRLREQQIKDGQTPTDPFTFFNEAALDAGRYKPEEKEEDINTVLNQYSYDQFSSWSEMLTRLNTEYQNTTVSPEVYFSVKEALDKLIENNVSFGQYDDGR